MFELTISTAEFALQGDDSTCCSHTACVVQFRVEPLPPKSYTPQAFRAAARAVALADAVAMGPKGRKQSPAATLAAKLVEKASAKVLALPSDTAKEKASAPRTNTHGHTETWQTLCRTNAACT